MGLILKFSNPKQLRQIFSTQQLQLFAVTEFHSKSVHVLHMGKLIGYVTLDCIRKAIESFKK